MIEEKHQEQLLRAAIGRLQKIAKEELGIPGSQAEEFVRDYITCIAEAIDQLIFCHLSPELQSIPGMQPLEISLHDQIQFIRQLLKPAIAEKVTGNLDDPVRSAICATIQQVRDEIDPVLSNLEIIR